jgi:hypothetical protein
MSAKPQYLQPQDTGEFIFGYGELTEVRAAQRTQRNESLRGSLRKSYICSTNGLDRIKLAYTPTIRVESTVHFNIHRFLNRMVGIRS